MSPDDVMLNKAAIVERCIRRIHEEHRHNPEWSDITRLDALVLNVERACQASIDLAMHVVARHHLGVPQSSAGAFVLLEKSGTLDPVLSRALQGMTGFRNVVIHEYQEMDLEVLRWIVRDGWRDWVRFCEALGLRVVVEEP